MLTDRLVPQWAEIARSVGAHDTLMKPVRRERIGSLLKVYGRLCRPSNVLLVETSPKLRDIIGSMAAAIPFRLNLDLSDSAVEAVRSLAPEFYEVALVNLSLADGDGVETALRIAARSPSTRVVTYGVREGYSASLLKQLGVAAHLPTPFKEHELEKALYDAFGLWRPYLLNALGRVEQLDQSAIDYLFR
jgi:DNA-binding NarL/FixJ family response regulator